MVRAARVHSHDLGAASDFLSFGCWGRDCPSKFAEPIQGELWLYSSFVWSREERLYLVPRKEIAEFKKSQKQKHEERGAKLREDIDRFDFLERTEGKPVADRWAAQMLGERYIKKKGREHPKIKADGRGVRVRCPLCEKVSILSYHANGAANDDAQREQNQENGHLRLWKPP